MAALSPLDLLRDMQARAQKNAAGLPSEEEALDTWTGVGFFVGQQELLAPLNDVVEILDPIECTKIPSVKPWFKGLANIRGNLMPVVDFHQFLHGESLPQTSSTRVVVFRDEGVNAGIVVSNVVGMRHFQMDERSERSESLDAGLKDFVMHAFQRSGEVWDVFSFKDLAQSDQFVQIASV
jgi:twitching motility protein PilI